MKFTTNKIFEFMLNNSDIQTFKSGQKTFSDEKVLSCDFDEKSKNYLATVKGNANIPIYKTSIRFDYKNIFVYCSCNRSEDDLCSHLVATLCAINYKFIAKNDDISFKKNVHIISDFSLNKTFIWRNSTKTIEKKLQELNENAEISITPIERGYEVELADTIEVSKLTLKKGTKDELSTSCSCNYKSNDLCAHVLYSLQYLLENKGKYAFELTYNWQQEKERLLNKYGLSLTDDLEGNVEFTWASGKPKLKILNHDFVREVVLNKSGISTNSLIANDVINLGNTINQPTENPKNQFTIAYVINFLKEFNLGILAIDIISGRYDEMSEKYTSVIQKLGVRSKSQIFSQIKNLDFEEFLEFRENFISKNIQKKIAESFPAFGKIITSNNYQNWAIRDNDIPVYLSFIPYYLPLIHQLFEKLQDKLVFITKNWGISTYTFTNIKKVQIADKSITSYFDYSITNNSIVLKPVFLIDNQRVEDKKFVQSNIWYVQKETMLYPWHNISSILIYLLTVAQQKISLTFNHQNFPEFIEKFIQPYHLKIKGINEDDLQIEDRAFEPIGKIRLAETGNFLLFYPTVKYGDEEVLINREKDMFNFTPGCGYARISRNRAFEKEFKDFFVSLHKNFNPNTFLEYYSLHCDDAMRRTWFVNFYNKCKDKGIEVYGFNSLKQFRFSTDSPKTSYSIKSNIDWFDLHMEINFGSQKASLLDVRKAILKNENIIMLGDGSLGMLPEEWLNNWSDLLKFGYLSEGKFKVSNIHYTLLDNFQSENEFNNTLTEVEERTKIIESYKHIPPVKVSPLIKAELRDYQLEGLKWLAFLASNRWGGCLADDMGLGKTLQILALFCHLSDKNKELKNKYLVVSPTTLIFNWQNEINKFCPHFRTSIYHGSNRKMDEEIFNNNDIFLTSYGTLVYDIKFVKDIHFTCIVLDESQSVKNVNSLRYKAANLMHADHRFVLTGTPIENSTLELYAQMQFANPGLLGSFAFFKNEFFETIDKKQDSTKTKELINLIRPFILRRTKEEVAKDLPEKTEMILFCEMEEEQRLVYDSFRIEIRKRLLGKIDEIGIQKAKMNILESLLKLRQICDSPALMKTERDFGNSSAKADELFRHIKSKTGKHKILVFSQFLGMLKIITERLEAENINYSYLDGKTTDRQGAVEIFQKDPTCRVFVLSLKAAGLGLNLTEADYVYLIDPWWNPAVEEQAMGRAHRIGQKNKVFAYRMICKDTIEEKIIELQNRKKALSDKIISSESSFVQNLSREDLEDLLN